MTARDSESAELRARKQTAGRVGFAMGCVATIVAAGINFARAPRPFTLGVAVLIVLVAALNIPLGIVVGLLGERFSRRSVER
jgi:hypothetical protein